MRVKWTDEMLRKEAAKHNTKQEFRNNNYAAYLAAKRRGLNKFCDHMISPYVKWTDEMLRKEAAKHNSRSSFEKNHPAAYSAALKRRILDKICPKKLDRSGNNNPNFKWTKLNIASEALKYETRSDFQRKSNGAYNAALRLSILEDVCSHMAIKTSFSNSENDLFIAIKKLYADTKKLKVKNVKIKRRPYIAGFEIDIFIPSLNKGIEFDGLYHHSIAGLKRGRKHWPLSAIKNYHKIKDGYFNSIGIDILHIKEVDWNNDRDKSFKECVKFLKEKRNG